MIFDLGGALIDSLAEPVKTPYHGTRYEKFPSSRDASLVAPGQLTADLAQ
jgi:hypothetical protein